MAVGKNKSAPTATVPDIHGRAHGTPVEALQAELTHQQAEITGLVDELRAHKVSHEDTSKAPPVASAADVRKTPQSKRGE